MIACQFFQSRLWISIAIGEPSVSPARTPERNSIDVLLDLHASSAAVALLAAREFNVDVVGKQRHAAGHSFQNAHESWAVRLAGGCESKVHRGRVNSKTARVNHARRLGDCYVPVITAVPA